MNNIENSTVYGTVFQIAHVEGKVIRHNCQHQDDDTGHTPETDPDNDPHANCSGAHPGPGGAPVDCDGRAI